MQKFLMMVFQKAIYSLFFFWMLNGKCNRNELFVCIWRWNELNIFMIKKSSFWLFSKNSIYSYILKCIVTRFSTEQQRILVTLLSYRGKHSLLRGWKLQQFFIINIFSTGRSPAFNSQQSWHRVNILHNNFIILSFLFSTRFSGFPQQLFFILSSEWTSTVIKSNDSPSLAVTFTIVHNWRELLRHEKSWKKLCGERELSVGEFHETFS